MAFRKGVKRRSSSLTGKDAGIELSNEIKSHALFTTARAVLCGYMAVSIPLRIAFIPDYTIQMTDYGPFVVCDLIFMVAFCMDAIRDFSFNRRHLRDTARISPIDQDYATRSVVKSTRPVSNAGHWLFISIFGILPLEYIPFLVGSEESFGLANYLLFNRMVIVLQLPSYINNLADCFEECGIIKNIGIQRAWKLFFAMALAGHWCGCGFFLCGKLEALKQGGDLTWPEDLALIQVERVSGNEGPSLTYIVMLTSVPVAYIQSLYWAYITMITTGFGDIVPLSITETVWCMISMTVGVIITTCAIANLQLLVTNADAAFADFQHKTAEIGKYMKYRRLPKELQNRIISFYRYKWDLLKGADEEQFLGELPSSLQQQVANFMCRDVIASLPLFRRANVSLLNALADCVEINIYSPNDDILKKGEQLRGAVLVSRGKVEVLSGVRVERKMGRLDSIGVESLFSSIISNRTVRAKTFCEIFLLPSLGFQQIIHAQCGKDLITKMKDTASRMSMNNSKVHKLFGSSEDHIPSRGVNKHFRPSSDFRFVWEVVILVGLISYLFSLPLTMMRFSEGAIFCECLMSFIISYLVDILFIVDLFLNFNHFMYYEEGLVVFQQDCIRKNYIRQHNIPREIIAALPIDLFAIFLPPGWSFILRLTKLLRLPNLVRSMDQFERAMAEIKVDRGLTILKVGKLNLALLVTCHWIACLWHSCADLGLRLGFDTTWRIVDEGDTSMSIDHSHLSGAGSYLRSVYWAIVGMSTVGYGDIVPTNMLENTVATVVILFGGLILPAIVGGLAAYMANLDLAERTYREKLFRVKQYMRHRSMDKDLIDKVINYYDYLWARQGAIDEESVLDELPLPLRQEVAMYVSHCHIDAVPFLSDCDNIVKQLLAISLRSIVYLPMDHIVHKGDTASSMFIIEKGVAAVVAEGDFVHCVLRRGNYFGEVSLLSSEIHNSSVKALTYCDVFRLSNEDFREIMDVCPSEKKDNVFEGIRASLHRDQIISKNVYVNMRDRPKCTSRVCRESCQVEQMNEQQKFSSSNHAAPYSPDSKLCTTWSIIIVIVVVYNLWIVPYRLAFSIPEQLHCVDWVLDCILIVDMYMNYCKIAYRYQGELIRDLTKVQQHYIKKRLKLDLIATLPLDLVYLCIFHSGINPITAAFLRTPRILWLFRLPKNLKDIFRVLEDTDMNLSPLKLVEFLTGVILVAHWAGCGFHAFARWHINENSCSNILQNDTIIAWATEYTECKWDNTWIKKQIINGKLPTTGGEPWQRYIRSFNWALPTLVVVVIGDVVPVNMNETLYAFIWMVVGVSVNAAIIGNVANIVTNINTDSSNFAKKADEMKRFMNWRHVSSDLRNRIQIFLTELWEHREEKNGESILIELPETLQVQVTQTTRYGHVRNCPFFDFCSAEILQALSLRLKLSLFSSGDTIIHFGDMGHEMFFLEKGTVVVMSENENNVLATLSAEHGAEDSNCVSVFFGETSLFFKRQRGNTVRATTFCEVYRLDKDDIDDELQQRDFDLSRMLDVFTSIANRNEIRNNAVVENLHLCRSGNSKLSRLIDPDDSSRVARQIRKIFIPNSLFRICLDLACAVFSAYLALEIPLRAAFWYEEDTDKIPTWMFINFVIDSFFILESYLRFFHFPFTKNGVIISDSERIRQEYKHNGIVPDIIASIPVEFFAFYVGFDYLVHLRIIHMVRIVRLPSYLSRIEVYLNLINARISAATRLLSRMFAYYFIVIHWYGCIWFTIHRYFESDVKYTWATTDCPGGEDDASNGCLSTWVEDLGRHNICNEDMIGRCYIRSVYFVLTTMSTVGYGDISPVTEFETIYQNIVVLTGACFFAGIIGSFGEFLSYNDESGLSAFKTKLQKLQEYMNYRHLPPSLQNEILFYHRTKWDQSIVLNESTVTTMLPKPLQEDLSFEILVHTIRKFPILNESSLVVRKRICHAFTLQMCPAAATIYSAGDIGRDVYFIGAGLVDIELPSDLSILDEEGRANVEKMKEKAAALGLLYRTGNHFGESCLVSTSGVRQETALAKTMVELYILSKDRLEQILTHASAKEREKLVWNLQSRNGNTRHSFDEVPTKITVRSNGFRKSTISMVRSPTSFVSWFKPQGLSLQQMQQSCEEPGDDIEEFGVQDEKSGHRYRSRLRSFSAQASTQALSRKRSSFTKIMLRPPMHVIAAAMKFKHGIIREEEEEEENFM